MDLDPATAYAIARLRVDVFVVEQRCAYPELDGRDVEPGAEHRWIDGGDAARAERADGRGAHAGHGQAPGGAVVLACLRVLAEGDGARRIGRVATAAPARGRGLAAALVGAVVADHGDGVLVLDAQAHLQGWYARFGFAVDGPGFVEDAIPHVPMRRAAQASPATRSASSVRRPV